MRLSQTVTFILITKLYFQLFSPCLIPPNDMPVITLTETNSVTDSNPGPDHSLIDPRSQNKKTPMLGLILYLPVH